MALLPSSVVVSMAQSSIAVLTEPHELLKKYRGRMQDPRSNEKQAGAAGRRWIFGECEYIELSRQLLVRGQPVRLESKPLDVLQLLLERPAQVLTKDELIGAAWNTATTDQSLATAISKLRKAFEGPRDSVILNVPGIGYRMAVPVLCIQSDDPDAEPAPPAFSLHIGDAIPHREQWVAVRPLDQREPRSVWLAEHRRTHAARVFKFAVDGVRLQALQREVALSRIFAQTLKDDERFVRIMEWNFEQLPFFIESEYGGLNLFEFSETEDFKRMPLEERVALAAAISGAVAEAHGLGILHNDLKPSNVLLLHKSGPGDGKGDVSLAASWQIKVADFGVASLQSTRRLHELQITHHGEFDESGNGPGSSSPRGTAMYRAPEMSLPGARPSMSGDVYALGVMLYQILCGDFLEPPSPGWEARIPDPLLCEDIAAAANIDVNARLAGAAELTERLNTLAVRRVQRDKRAAEASAGRQAAEQVARARARRPWVILAVAALAVAFCLSFWFYRRAVQQRNAAVARTATLASMNEFLTTDLLNQSNPFLARANAGPVTQETLLDAIQRILPQIDRRFQKDPEIAGQIHETLGSALNNRSQFAASEQQFAFAAQQFRKAQGPLSQNAIICELQREGVQFRSRQISMAAQARAGFAAQQKLMEHIHNVSPELQAWEAMTETGMQLFGTRPAQALSVLSAAVRRAELTPGFNPLLLTALKLRFCGMYLKLGRYSEAEQVAREVIYTETARAGESPAVFQPEMLLEEALFEEGRYAAAIAQSSHDYSQFSRALGPNDLLTLSALDMRVQAEASAGQHAASLQDDLALHAAASANPSAGFLAGDSLNMASQAACRNGSYNAGIAYARELIAENSVGASAQPYLFNVGSFALAQCLIATQESAAKPGAAVLGKIGHLLDGIRITLVSQMPGMNEFSAAMALTRARLDLLEGHVDSGRQEVEQAAPVFAKPGADPYYRAMLARVRAELGRRSSAKP